MRLVSVVVISLVLLGVSVVFAQDRSCPAQIEQALAAVQDSCAKTGRNQACYGNIALQATARQGVTDFTFEEQGDRVNVVDLATLQLSSFDEVLGQWGIAILKLQANIPNSLPGQNVTFVLFGDVEIENAVDPSDESLTPMQAFRFSTRLGSTACDEAPESGILIQTPAGVGTISLRANGVDIELGSTAYLTAQPTGEMTVSVVEGEARLTVNDGSVTVSAGSQSVIEMDEELIPLGEPGEPIPYEAAPLDVLPISLLPETITIAPPGGDASSTQTPAPVTLNLNDPSSWASIPPEQLCPALDRDLAASGMTRDSLMDMLEQLKGMEGANIPNIEAVQQAIRGCP
jgi:hypothetical protein